MPWDRSKYTTVTIRKSTHEKLKILKHALKMEGMPDLVEFLVDFFYKEVKKIQESKGGKNDLGEE